MSGLEDAFVRFDEMGGSDLVETAFDCLMSDEQLLIVSAARLLLEPMDELWYCKQHQKEISVFLSLTPVACYREERPGPCEPVAALIVEKPSDPPEET